MTMAFSNNKTQNRLKQTKSVIEHSNSAGNLIKAASSNLLEAANGSGAAYRMLRQRIGG